MSECANLLIIAGLYSPNPETVEEVSVALEFPFDVEFRTSSEARI